MSWMIKAEDVSKMYRLGTIGAGSLQDDFKKIWYQIRGKDNPFLKIGEDNMRDTVGGDHVWALKDINFEVPKGEVMGIIGKNGAGKSTLLKLLSKVTKPTTGSIKTRGRIASLLEVGTGFHPELTGRENIFLNGAILGMKKHEIKLKFDEIVAFSGCERYIDTPVKRYSSGMYVRLAFAVAAHLEPEILVVDEVLAVGDAEFQKKAIGKMKDISEGQGRTVLFVSHTMSSIQELCTNVMVMKNGGIDFIGNTKLGINKYLEKDKSGETMSDLEFYPRNDGFGNFICFNDLLIRNSKNISTTALNFYESFSLEIGIKNKSEAKIYNIVVGISDSNYDRVVSYQSDDFEITENTSCTKNLSLSDLNLTPGKYYITLGLKQDKSPLDHLEFIQSFEIKDLREIDVENKLDYLGKIAHKHIKWI